MGRVIMSGIVPLLKKPAVKILASSLAVGDTVKLMENGSAVEFLVVHQGLPSSMYDASCNGTWLLRKDIIKQDWFASNSVGSDYSKSSLNVWLNGGYFETFGENEQNAIKSVKIPYVNGDGESGGVANKESGLSTKIFALSCQECGWTTADKYMPILGVKLDYFEVDESTSAKSKRKAYYQGKYSQWWTRNPYLLSTTDVYVSLASGVLGGIDTPDEAGYRPALILPSTAKLNDNYELIG